MKYLFRYEKNVNKVTVYYITANAYKMKVFCESFAIFSHFISKQHYYFKIFGNLNLFNCYSPFIPGNQILKLCQFRRVHHSQEIIKIIHGFYCGKVAVLDPFHLAFLG